MSQKKVFKNTFYYIVASSLPIAANLVVLPLFTRYLSPQDYGILALTQLFCSFMVLILSLQIHSSIGRYYFDFKGEDLRILISTISLTLFVLSSFILLISLVFLDRILSLVFPKIPPTTYVLFKLILIAGFFNTLTSVSTMLLRAREEGKLFMKISLSLSLVGLILSITEVVILKRGARGVVEAILISSILGFIVYTFSKRQFFRPKFNVRMLKGPIKYSLPMIPHALSGLIFMYSDRIILEKYVSLSAIGLYFLSNKVAVVFKTIVNQLNVAFQPHFMKTAKTSKNEAVEDAKHMARTAIFFVCFLVTIVAVFSVELVYFVLDRRYFKVWLMIPLIASSYIFRSLYCFASSGLFFERKTGKVSLITLTAGVVNILINLLFIPVYGVMVAVYSTVVAFMVAYLMAVVMSINTFYVKLDNIPNLLFVGYMYLAIIFSSFANSKFTLESPALPMNIYVIKLAIVCCGIYLGFKARVLNFSCFKKQ